MRDLLRGFAAAALESAVAGGRAAQVASDLTGFARVLVDSDLLRNSLSDPAIPATSRRGVVTDLLEHKAAAETIAVLGWAALVEPAADFPAVVMSLVELAEEMSEATAEGRLLETPAEELAGGRTAVRERIRGYADRLFQEVSELARIDDIEDELFRFARVVDANPELRRALGDPSIPVGRRAAVVEELLRSKAQPATVRLVGYVLRAGHVRDLVGTLEWLAELAAEERGRRVAEVRSAVELDEAERLRLAAALERTIGRPVEVRVQIDPSVLGGMTIAIGDTVIDGSVRHRLEQLREALAPAAGGVLGDHPNSSGDHR